MTTFTYTIEYQILMKRIVSFLGIAVFLAVILYAYRTYTTIHNVAVHARSQKSITALERKVSEHERTFASLQKQFGEETAIASGYIRTNITVARVQ